MPIVWVFGLAVVGWISGTVEQKLGVFDCLCELVASLSLPVYLHACFSSDVSMCIVVKWYTLALYGKPISELWNFTCPKGSQCYLLLDAGECALFQPQPDRQFTYSGGWKAELILIVGHISRWFTCLQTVVHPSSNQ